MPTEQNRVSPLSSRLRKILETNAPIHPAIDPVLGRVISSVLANPGSLFRAELTFLAAQAYRLPDSLAESLACAVEYFHVASLLFDDLPFMDDATIRRGEVCAHVLHGEAASSLAALALITRAYALIGVSIARAPANRQEFALSLVERCLGTVGMLNGQARDLHFDATRQQARHHIGIALVKTVPLIELALALAPLLGGAGEAELRMLRRLSVCWGLLYQGVDDLKDVLETTEASGKSSNQDERLARPNVARQLGLSGTARYLQRLEKVAILSIIRLEGSGQKLTFLRTYHELLIRRVESLPIGLL